MSQVHANVAKVVDVREAIDINRGISMGSASTRKAPNAFMFVRQMEILVRDGSAEEQAAATCLKRSVVHLMAGMGEGRQHHAGIQDWQAGSRRHQQHHVRNDQRGRIRVEGGRASTWDAGLLAA